MAQDEEQRVHPADPVVLLVENELMVALEMENTIRDAGLCEVCIAGDDVAARGLIAQTDKLAGAILDVRLSHGTSLDLAEDLLARGVPVVFATGYDTGADYLERFPDVPVISKPFEPTELLAAVARLLSATATSEQPEVKCC